MSSSKAPPRSGKVSRVRPIQRATIPKLATPLAGSARNGGGGNGGGNGSFTTTFSMSASPNIPTSSPILQGDISAARQKQLIAEQASYIRELETQLAELRKQNVHLHREMQEALGLHQLKSRTVDALTKDLTGKSDVEQRLNDFLLSVEADCLDAVTEEVLALRKKCFRSEEYLAELNEKYREAVLRNQQLEESLSDLKAEIAVKLVSDDQTNPIGPATSRENLKSLAKRNATLEQKCESLTELKGKIVKLEVERRDLKAENTQLKGKMSALLRDKKQLNERLTNIETDGTKKINELKEAQARHLEMLSKLRRSYTKMDAKYKHLLKERTQWQSLFRTANGELSKSTESLASISSAASTSVSRASFFRDSSNLEEYNIHLESELVAVKENLKLSEKERDRLEKKLKGLAEQVLQDENLITELDQNRAAIMEEHDGLRQKCLSLEEDNTALQRNVEELREQLDTALFENNEMSLREEDARSSLAQAKAGSMFDPTQNLQLYQEQMLNAETITDFVNNVMTKQERALISRLDAMDENITALAARYEHAKSQLIAKNAEVERKQQTIAELSRQVEVLKNNAESLAKDLGVEVRDRSATEMARMQDEISAKDAKLKDYEKIQKVLKKALVENENLKESTELFKTKTEAAESRIVELENQLKCEQNLVTESNGKLNQRLRQAERENERLQSEFSIFEEQIAELERAKNALSAVEVDRETLKQQIASLEGNLAEVTYETERLRQELNAIRTEQRDQTGELQEASSKAEGLKMALEEKAQQIATLIKSLEEERVEKSSLERVIFELQQQNEKNLDEKDQKMAQLASEMKAANQDLEHVLREKALTIEALEKQILESTEIKQREIDELSKVHEEHVKRQNDAKTVCLSFVNALEIKVDHDLSLSEFIPQMIDAALKLVQSKTQQLEDVGIELERTRKEAEQGVSFAITMEQLKNQLSRDEESLKNYEEALATQSASIERLKVERADLERNMIELHKSDDQQIKRLKEDVRQLEAQLEKASHASQEVSALQRRCLELEAQHEVNIAEKNETISNLESRLEDKITEFDELNQKVENFTVLEEHLNSMTIQVSLCHTKIEELEKDIEDKEQKLIGKNQIIYQLENELSEKTATFDEMEKIFSLKGEEYKKVREMLDTSEESIKQLNYQLSLTDSTVKKLSSTLLPNATRDSAEMWVALSKRVDEVFKELRDAQEKTKSLEKQLEHSDIERNAVIDQMNDLQRVLETRQNQLENATLFGRNLQILTEKLTSDLDAKQSAYTDAMEELQQLKADTERMTLDLTAKQNELDDNAVYITRLRNLLTESESVIRGLSEQHNDKVINLVDKIQSINREREALQACLGKKLKETVSAQSGSAAQAALKGEIARLGAENEELLAEKKSWNELRLQLESRTTQAEANYADKCQELEELTKVLAMKQTDMARFEDKLHALKNKYGDRVQSLQQNVSILQSERAKVAEQINDIQQELKAAAEAKGELETSLQNKCESLEVLRSEMDLLEGKLQEMCSQYEECQKKLDDREAEVARLVDEIGNVKIVLSERTEDVSSYHDHIKALAEEKIRLEGEAAHLKQKINDNSEEYQREALEMQQELSIMTERYNIKCHECESLSKDVATKAADVDVLTVKLLSMESNLYKATTRIEDLEKMLAQEKYVAKQLSEDTHRKDEAFATTNQPEGEISITKSGYLKVQQELKYVKSQLDDTLRKKCETELKLKAAEYKANELNGKLNKMESKVELESKQLSSLADGAASYQTELQIELDTARGLLLNSEREALALKLKYEEQLNSLRDELSSRIAKKDSQRILQEEAATIKDSTACRERLTSQQFEGSINLPENIRDELSSEKSLGDCLRTEKVALEEELTKVQVSLKESQNKLLQARHIIEDLETAKSKVETQLEESLAAVATAHKDQKKLDEKLTESRRSTAFLEEHLANLREKTVTLKDSIGALTTEKATLEQKYAQLNERDAKHRQSIRELQHRLDSMKQVSLDRAGQLEAANREVNLLHEYRRVLEQVQETLELKTPERIVPLVRQHKSTIAQLGSGMLMIRRELNGQQRELSILRQLVTSQRAELSVLVTDTSHQLEQVVATAEKASTQQQQQQPREHLSFQKTSRPLVDRCLEVLREHNMRSLAKTLVPTASPVAHGTALATTVTASGESGAGGEVRSMHNLFTLPPNDFDMHFQTFNGPTAQFVAEQQASSAARLKLMKLAAVMDHDDTAPSHATLNTSNNRTPGDQGLGRQQQHNDVENGDNATGTNPSSLIRIDPFETIKQQKILIHELMAKLERTKKVLDGEMIRRKELDERFRQWSSDKRLHNAEVFFNVAQINSSGSSIQREDTFDCAPLLKSQGALIPETSLNVTRQFPSYVDNFIRWLITTAPPRSEMHPVGLQRRQQRPQQQQQQHKSVTNDGLVTLASDERSLALCVSSTTASTLLPSTTQFYESTSCSISDTF
ncbi:sporulation-specific protein 15-like isoform X2 [Varroa jacobsoni]|uniref:sporulation-specific protein 15-like isoform X2 n=1 Tax=Varroa jacobsoni TaxID=62625 RepID=UPI000BF90234|nr:sporulation-specific protein 15-like isoform X2 [Varroa jacobsoni]